MIVSFKSGILRDKTMADKLKIASVMIHKIEITISGWNVLTFILLNQQIKI